MNGTLVREIRKSLSLTQSALGLRIGVAERTVQRWETGESRVSGAAVTLLNQLKEEILRSHGIDVPIKRAKPTKKRRRLWRGGNA